MNKISKNWIIVAKFGRPHGVKGWVSVISHTEPRENLLKYHDWHIKRHGEWEPLEIAELQVNAKHILAKLPNLDDRDAVAMLTNLDIAVNEAQLPELESDEYYWHQILGLDVYTPQGLCLGQVKEIRPTGANDVLVVQGTGKNHLIPYLLPQYVLSVDLLTKRIVVDWDPDF